MRVTRMWAFALLVACGGKDEAPPSPSPGSGPTAPGEPSAPAPPAAPAFPEGTRSLELTRTVGVRLEPGDDAKRIGNIAIDTRVRWNRTQKAKGCQKPWVEIQPRGWVCGDYLRPSKKPAMGREVPMLDRGEIVPGIYGKVTVANSVTYALEKPDPKKDKQKAKDKTRDKKATDRPVTSPRDVTAAPVAQPKMVEDKPLVGSINVRQYEEVTIGGKIYWRVSQKDNEYVLRSAITQHRPSVYGGARLGDDTGIGLPIAFVWPRAGYQATSTFTKGAGGTSRQLAANSRQPRQG